MKKGEDSWKAALNSLGSARASRAGDGALAITDFPKIDDQYKTFIGWGRTYRTDIPTTACRLIAPNYSYNESVDLLVSI
jgi:hypothetical protein